MISKEPVNYDFLSNYRSPVTNNAPSPIQHALITVREAIRQSCEVHGRDPGEVRLIAVSKTYPSSHIAEAFAHGQRAFGENRMQDLAQKMQEMPDASIEWHFIGGIQSNKLRLICHRVDWIHSVDKLKYLLEIENRAAQHNRTVNCLIQVNISGESQKEGLEPDEIDAFFESLPPMPHVQIRGLMGMASLTEDRQKIREQFRHLRQLRDRLRESVRHPHVRLEELSMGMSGDMDLAIAEGSTMVRIGTSIFGSRAHSI